MSQLTTRPQENAAGAGPNAARTRSAAAVSRRRGPASRSQRSAREGGSEMRVTAVVVTYNRRHMLLESLAAVLAQAGG